MQSEDLRNLMRETYNELIDFVISSPFRSIIDELYSLPPLQRPGFVKEVILDPEELDRRDVTIPDGILIQRSAFGDKRPTLFVVKKYLPEKYRASWENVNLTFDQVHDGHTCAQGVEAWRKPLPMEVQAALSAMGISNDDLKEMENAG